MKFLKKYQKKKNISIIVIYKIIENPISHDLWNIIDVNKAKNLGLNDPTEIGINENIIERFKTINSDNKKNKYNISSYKLFGDKNSKKYHILETLNNNSFRFLCPWNNCYHNEINNYFISGFLNYLEIDKYNSTNKLIDRVYLYQKIHRQSLNKLFLKNKLDIELIGKESQIQIDSNYIRNKSVFNIMKLIKKNVELSNHTKISKPRKIIDLILNDQKIADDFINTIVYIFNEKYIKIDYLNNPEVYSLFLFEINTLKNLFITQLFEYYDEIKQNKKNEIANLSSSIQIINYLEDIIKNVINDIILTDSNVYYNIFVKAKLVSVMINP